MNGPACKHCKYFGVTLYTYVCVAPAVRKERIDVVSGETIVSGDVFVEKLRADPEKCGPDAKWFEPYRYLIPRIETGSPLLNFILGWSPLTSIIGLILLDPGFKHPYFAGFWIAGAIVSMFVLLEATICSRDVPP